LAKAVSANFASHFEDRIGLALGTPFFTAPAMKIARLLFPLGAIFLPIARRNRVVVAYRVSGHHLAICIIPCSW